MFSTIREQIDTIFREDPAARAAIRVVEEVRKGRTVWRRDPTRR